MIDRNSETWRYIERWASERRALAVQGLITTASGDDRNRGEIRALDELLALVDDQPPLDNEPRDY